jgi:hypothetical protein
MVLLLILLYQVASVGAARVAGASGPPGHGGPASEGSSRENPVTAGPGHRATPGRATPEIDVSPDHELLLAFLRGKGGSFPGSQRALARALGWGRGRYDRVTKPLVDFGVLRVGDGSIDLVE